MTTALTQNKKVFNLNPQSLVEAESFAKMICKSSLCPTSFKGKADDVLVAILMGAEVGLSPMQALQNIAVISGKPCIYGDGAIALVLSSPQCDYVKEWSKGSFKNKDLVWFCEGKRKGKNPEIRKFSYEDAERAGLLKKVGVWQQYPDRMIQMRARGFCLRDVFADALKGLSIREEIEDIPPASIVNPESSRAKELNERFDVIEDKTNDEYQNKNHSEIKKVKIDKSKLNQETGEIIEQEKAPYTFEELKEAMQASNSKDELNDLATFVSQIGVTKEQHAELSTVYREKLKTVQDQ